MGKIARERLVGSAVVNAHPVALNGSHPGAVWAELVAARQPAVRDRLVVAVGDAPSLSPIANGAAGQGGVEWT